MNLRALYNNQKFRYVIHFATCGAFALLTAIYLLLLFPSINKWIAYAIGVLVGSLLGYLKDYKIDSKADPLDFWISVIGSILIPLIPIHTLIQTL